MPDYNALRARTLGSTQEEEAVTVNTRALIDKVLARYSSENTTLRELLQNAADANASSVEVRFQTSTTGSNEASSAQDVDLREFVKSKVQRVMVKNDGHSFREEDWQRLKRIAEGNPDETKIGAFGVGFYSVFADCEEPFVSSGSEAMAFYWKGNSLFTRRAKMDSHDPFTTLLLEYREPSELPDLRELCKFFATSLTFVKLSSISLYLDDYCLLSLNKKVSPSMPITISSNLNPVTSEKWMKIARVDTESVQIDAKYMNITHYLTPIAEIATGLRSIFSRFALPQAPTHKSNNGINVSNLAECTSATIFLRIATATVNTSVTTAFARELERATKKPPPKTTKLAILTMSKDELDASEQGSEIFSNVLPNKTGKVFIGFPTHQTTSISAHISAHSVIPTVERENIDLNARTVKMWNIEMLRIAGILARIMYADEMSIIGNQARGLKTEDLKNLYDHAIHIMNQFTFVQSTPSASVGKYIESGFWDCSKTASIELMSTKGVLPSEKVRLSSEITFLEGLPMLPGRLAREASKFVKHLKQGGFLTEITAADIENELSHKALSGVQLGEFLRWLADKRLVGELNHNEVRVLLEVAIAITSTTEKNTEESIPISLAMIQNFVNPQKLAADIPLPPQCIPFSVTKNLTKEQLQALGWLELDIVSWLQYICSQSSVLPVEHNIALSPKFSQQALAIISKSWDTLSPESKSSVTNALKDRTCIPTKQGMKIPREAYFASVKLFSDLPLVGSMHGVKDKLLVALGVRKTVELRIVFERLMSDTQAEGAIKWSHFDLIKYLASVREDIPSDDITKLKNTAFCKAEAKSSKSFYKVSELYEPNDSLKKLRLPIVQWPGVWKTGTPEVKFLTFLGLKNFPTVPEVLKIAGNTDDEKLREVALWYFINNFHLNSYQTYNTPGISIPFLPLERVSGEGSEKSRRLVTPKECFSNPKASLFGFEILRTDLHPHASKFGVMADPDMKDCVSKIVSSPPSTHRAAREQFAYLSTRLAEIMPHHINILSQAEVVPIPIKDVSSEKPPSYDAAVLGIPEKKVKHIPPRICYLGGSGSPYAGLFDFADFGQEANAFLLQCGSKHEPTVSEVAYMMVREPWKLYSTLNPEKYTGILRNIAANWEHLKKDKILVREMKKSKCLIAHKEVVITSKNNGTEEPEGTIKESVLARAEEVLMIDEFTSYILFKEEILAAPQEDSLENLYLALGASRLSARVMSEWRIGSAIASPERAERLRKLVLERSRLFLHTNTDTVRNDARWLEQNLKVQLVDSIKLRKTLKHQGAKEVTHLQDRTATMTPNLNILSVTTKHSLYDVSQALVALILRNPKPHSSLLLESLLSTDLLTLKSRGYNVDRILRAKAAEAKLAETHRQQKIEEQRRAFEEQEKRYLAQQQKEAKQVEENKYPIPGAFDGSPRNNGSVIVPEPPAAPPVPVGFFGKLTKRFGLERDSAQEQQMDSMLQNNDGAQPPDSPDSKRKRIKQSPNNGKPPIQTATEPHRIQTNLQAAVQASRSHGSGAVFSPPQTYEVKEQRTYCDDHPSQDIVFFGEAPNGIKLFVDRSLEDKDQFLKYNATTMSQFSVVLKDIAEVFALSIKTLHIFYDEKGLTIAFNHGGSLFCNLRYFIQLHAQDVAGGNSIQALIYWFVVLCHELAHNLVSDHSSEHSFYTETFVQEYFMPMMEKIGKGVIEQQRLTSRISSVDTLLLGN